MNDIKSKFDSLFTFSCQVSYINKHPLRIINASKSLIGINLQNPPLTLIKWIEKYIAYFSPDFVIPDLDQIKDLPEVISYSQLKEYIDKGKQDKAHQYLGHLLQSATPISIAEYLIEYAAQKSASYLLFCWSALRSIEFLGEKDGYPILYHCISNLINEENNSKRSLSNIEILYHQFQIRNSKMVRSLQIHHLLDKLVSSLEYDLDGWVPEKLKDMLVVDGINGIHQYLLNFEIGDFSEELIFKLDAIRSAILFSGFSINKIIEGSILEYCDS